jgi:hypothetical protein
MPDSLVVLLMFCYELYYIWNFFFLIILLHLLKLALFYIIFCLKLAHFFLLDLTEDRNFRDAIIELEIRNELLLEKVVDLQSSLSKLERKFWLFRSKHIDCKRKPFILYRWNVFVFFAVFCCNWHVDASLEIKYDCIRCLDECVEFLEFCFKEQ